MNRITKKLKLHRFVTMMKLIPRFWRKSRQIASANGVAPGTVFTDMLKCLYHVYLVYLVQRLIESFAFPSSLPFMLLYSVVAMWIMFGMRRIGWLERLLHPIRKR